MVKESEHEKDRSTQQLARQGLKAKTPDFSGVFGVFTLALPRARKAILSHLRYAVNPFSVLAIPTAGSPREEATFG